MALTLSRRMLGRTGIEVSLLGLGTVAFGRTEGLRYARKPDLPDDRTLRRLLDRARALGVNLIDTAPAYGTSEARLGELLAAERAEWVLVTKAGETFEGGVSRHDFSPAAIEASVLRSLARLRTDYIDVALLHSDGDDVAILERSGAIDALLEQKRLGRVRAVGISHKTTAGGLAALARCDVVMTALSQGAPEQLSVAAAAAARGCGVLVKKALDGGRATDVAAALGFVVGQPGVACVVVGTTDVAHLEANAAALIGRT
jgi:aryl-alcohol dehydrogenase-like predicted oxidoreductase